MKRAYVVLGAGFMTLALFMPGWAQVAQLPTQTVTISGTIETIDASRRTANIRTASGKIETIHVPVDVKQFDQFKVGDKVSATYNNAVSVKVKPPGEAPVDSMAGGSSMGQNVQTGGTAVLLRTMTVTVTDVDKSAQSISVEGPNGWRYSRRVADPAVLDRIKPGDRLDITWDTRVALAPQ